MEFFHSRCYFHTLNYNRGGVRLAHATYDRSRSGTDADEAAVAAGNPAFGGKLDAAQRLLRDASEQLSATATEHSRPFIHTSLAALEGLSCRLAVIGQVKAGKSSFVNALIGRPDFLPTDINPWTTAVTQIHFGVKPSEPDTAMAFRFFDFDEWDRLQHGTGLVRELTERLVLGFERERLRQNIDAIRDQAIRRIGGDFERCLGQTHIFDTHDRQVLMNYICAGAGSGTSTGEAASAVNYSDIVRTADIYFEGVAGQLPTTVVDTPGTNDPFMVRDEITRRALDLADIYVVVVMARQPLSTADLSLFRILRGLHKHRIVVFINRIDELDDIVGMTPRIINHVRDGLEREFPGANIPIIAGSALWANASSLGSDTVARRLLTPNLSAYAAQMPVINKPLDLAEANDLKHTLRVCSGIPRLLEVLGNSVVHSRPGHVVYQIGSSLRELASLQLAELRRDAATFEPVTREMPYDREEIRLLREDLFQDVKYSENLLNTLTTLMVDVTARLNQIVDFASTDLQTALKNDLYRFRNQESDRLMHALAVGTDIGRWHADIGGIRRLMEETVLAHYDHAIQKFDTLTNAVCYELERVLTEIGPESSVSIPSMRVEEISMPPQLVALSRFLVLDVSDFLWRRLVFSRSRPVERAAELSNLIQQEFHPVLQALVDAFDTRIKETHNQVSTRILLYRSLLVAALGQTVTETLNRLAQLDDDYDRRAEHERLSEGRKFEQQDLTQRIGQLEVIFQDLSKFCDDWGAQIDPPVANTRG